MRKCGSWVRITPALLEVGFTTSRLVCAESLGHKGPHQAHRVTWTGWNDEPKPLADPEAAERPVTAPDGPGGVQQAPDPETVREAP